MPAPRPARLRALYRSLLRELPPRPVLASPRPPLHDRLRAAFAPAPTTGPSASRAEAEAHQLVAYLRSQRQYVSLLERYNSGMDMTEVERLRLTARRVGMDMPVAYGRQEN